MTSLLPTRLAGPVLAAATHGLTKRFGDHVALSDVALQVPAGAVYLLVGPNGAGKSTTLKALLDLVGPDAGTVEVFGLRAVEDGTRIRANVGYVPERPDWGYAWMRVGQLLEYHRRAYRRARPAHARRGTRCPRRSSRRDADDGAPLDTSRGGGGPARGPRRLSARRQAARAARRGRAQAQTAALSRRGPRRMARRADATGQAHGGMSYHPMAAIPVALIGLLLPFSVWRAEDPARRSYLWAMPVPRGPHTLAKAFSGWV